MTRFRPWREPPPAEAADLEIRHHLDERARELQAAGLSEADARREASRAFGNVEAYGDALRRQARRQERAMRRLGWIRDLRDDLARAPRALAAVPGFAASVILTLAVGFGSATAVFATIDALLLRPLPFADPDALVTVSQRAGSVWVPSLRREHADALARDAGDLARWAAHARESRALSGDTTPRAVRIRVVSPELFDVLGRRPLLGRSLTAADAAPGAPPAVVLSHPTWMRLGGSPDIVGSQIALDGIPHRVSGVMPPDFRFPTSFAAEAFVALPRDGRSDGRQPARLELIGRLAPGLETDRVSGRIDAIFNAVLAERGEKPGEIRLGMLGEHRANSDVAGALWMLAAAVGLMVLVGLTNAIHLLVTRTSARMREIAVRYSLGATRGRIVRQLLAEGLLLAAASGAVAVLVARAGVPALMRAAPDELTVWAAHAVAVDWRVTAFAALLTVLLGVAFALLPAWGAARTTSRSASSAVGVHAQHTPARRRLRFALLAGEVMLTFVLLAGAALLTRSFVRLANVDPGFNPDGLAMVSLELSEATYRTADERAAFWRELEARLEALPGVTSVTIGSLPPEADVRVGALLQADDDAAPREDSPLLLPHSDVSPDYLPTLGVRLAAGRNFLPGEGPDSQVAIIDHDMARFLFGDADPVNRRFRIGERGSWRQVVGLVDDLKLGGPDDSRGAFVLLEPHGAAGYDSTFGDVAVRGAGDPEAILPLIRQAVSTIDPRQPLYSLQTADRVLAEVVADRRFFLTVMTTLGVLSVVLAGVGMYSLLAFLVARRRRELGIRVALGASGRTVAAAVLQSGLGAAASGCALGLLVAIWAGRLVQHLLFETEPTDTVSLAAVTALLLAVSVVASLIPARRAAQADPVEALRLE